MKNECNIIRDILPLYVEDMVSTDTAAFVAEHLEKCDACRAELENLKNSKNLENAASDAQEDVAHLKAFKRNWHRRTALIMAACILGTAFLAMLVMKTIIGGSYLISGGIVAICIVLLLIYLKTPRSAETNHKVGGLVMVIIAVLATLILGILTEGTIGVRFNMPGIGSMVTVAVMGAFILWAVRHSKK